MCGVCMFSVCMCGVCICGVCMCGDCSRLMLQSEARGCWQF